MTQLLYTAYPHLVDVWTTHLVPFIVCSKDEMDRKKLIVWFALDRAIQFSHDHRLVPSQLVTCAQQSTWYIHRHVIAWSSNFGLTNTNTNSQTIYHLCPNGSNCCSIQLIVRDRPDTGRTISRWIYPGESIRFTLHDNGQIWRHCANYYDISIYNVEAPAYEHMGLCFHLKHCLLMHAVRTKSHTLRPNH
jgi:hypothetical protein